MVSRKLDTQLIKAVARLEAEVKGLSDQETEEYVIDKVGAIYQMTCEMYDDTRSPLTQYSVNVMLSKRLEELKGGEK